MFGRNQIQNRYERKAIDRISIMKIFNRFQLGLCHYTAMAYDESMNDFQQSADYMQQAIEIQKTREQTSEVKKTIDDLTNLKEDILNKIAEVQETKELVIEITINF